MIRTPSIYSDEFWQENEMTEAPTPEPKAEPKISAFEHAANTFIQSAVSMLMNGLRSSLPQVPIAHLMVKTCSALGVSVGTVFSVGALGDIFPLRNECVKAFSEGVKSVKIQPAALPVGQKPMLNS